jgi:hypothetical protein
MTGQISPPPLPSLPTIDFLALIEKSMKRTTSQLATKHRKPFFRQ